MLRDPALANAMAMLGIFNIYRVPWALTDLGGLSLHLCTEVSACTFHDVTYILEQMLRRRITIPQPGKQQADEGSGGFGVLH